MSYLIIGLILLILTYIGGFWLTQKKYYSNDKRIFEVLTYSVLAVSIILIICGIENSKQKETFSVQKEIVTTVPAIPSQTTITTVQ